MISVHDLHVWQLVDGMIIASVHLMITEGTGILFFIIFAFYCLLLCLCFCFVMVVILLLLNLLLHGLDVGFIVYQVKQIFHSFGIHSSAIQPEFVKSLTPVYYPFFSFLPLCRCIIDN